MNTLWKELANLRTAFPDCFERNGAKRFKWIICMPSSDDPTELFVPLSEPLTAMAIDDLNSIPSIYPIPVAMYRLRRPRGVPRDYEYVGDKEL